MLRPGVLLSFGEKIRVEGSYLVMGQISEAASGCGLHELDTALLTTVFSHFDTDDVARARVRTLEQILDVCVETLYSRKLCARSAVSCSVQPCQRL